METFLTFESNITRHSPSGEEIKIPVEVHYFINTYLVKTTNSGTCTRTEIDLPNSYSFLLGGSADDQDSDRLLSPSTEDRESLCADIVTHWANLRNEEVDFDLEDLGGE